MTKPVEATSGQATVGPYYNINEYSGQLYKWSVERLNPDNLLCLPVGCLGVLVSLVVRVVEGALMLVVNFCIAVKGVVWGHTPTVTAPPANANTNPATPPAGEETGKGKTAKTKEEPASSKTKKAAKTDDAEEATPTKKADKKTAEAGKEAKTDDIEEEEEENGIDNEGDVADSEEEVHSADEAEAEESDEDSAIVIPKVRKPNLGALEDPTDLPEEGDEKTALPPSSGPKNFAIDWDATGINGKGPKWVDLTQAAQPPKPISKQSSILTRDRAKQLGAGAAVGLAATVAGLSAPFIFPLAAAGALAIKPDLVRSAWNSMRNLGPRGCQANRQKAREEETTPPLNSAPIAPSKTVVEG